GGVALAVGGGVGFPSGRGGGGGGRGPGGVPSRPLESRAELLPPAQGEARQALVASEPAAGEVPSPDPMLAHVLARALDQDSRPIQGATLECLDGRRARAESGADGRIELSLAAFPPAFELSFSLRAPGFATREASAAVAQGALVHLGDLVLAPGGTISGKVQDGRGQPVEGALLQVVELDRPHEE